MRRKGQTEAQRRQALAQSEGSLRRLYEGWRAELAGEPIRRLVEGDASLAFAGAGRLLLEERSGVAIGTPSAVSAASPVLDG